MKSNIFDPHKSFLSLKILWIVVIIHFAVAAILSILIIYNSNLTPSYDYHGLNNALNIFKIPLGILALTIPIVALLAANHRSEQTKEQMRLASENNNFSNFYKHTEEFESYLSEHEESNIKITLPRKFHRLAFPNSKNGDFKVGELIDRQINWFLEHIIHASSGLNNPQKWTEALDKLDMLITDFAESFYIKNYYTSTSGNSLPVFERTVFVPDGDVKNIIISVKNISEKIRDALLFDERYEPSELLIKVIEFDYRRIPSSKTNNISNYAPFDFKALLFEEKS
ncbi:hypothetical protein [Pseudomonas fluorescens]|uniref:Uncharacterized protein n=1 Tax=Pseudomonas fluorescens TaxID=294 RepID=A0A5E7VMX1_PSEFL|nr:hypothetical protein [Pseudomonas fluorescens]VVQ23934.1 hypothetical protein PS941_05663 [Pseudomonas fluorescens]